MDSEQPDHSISLDNVRILVVEPKCFERGVWKATQIQINNLTINKDASKYNLPAVWYNTLVALGRRAVGWGWGVETRSQDLQASVADS